MPQSYECILAFDPSTTSLGWALLSGWQGGRPMIQNGAIDASHLKDPDQRLDLMRGELLSLIGAIQIPKYAIQVVIEGYSYGSLNNRELMGEAVGIIKSACFSLAIRPMQLHRISIPEWKAAIYPHWYGFSKANWEAAGRTGKFKRSQPDKTAIRHQLLRDFDLRIQIEDAADAVGIVIGFNDSKYDREWTGKYGQTTIATNNQT